MARNYFDEMNTITIPSDNRNMVSTRVSATPTVEKEAKPEFKYIGKREDIDIKWFNQNAKWTAEVNARGDFKCYIYWEDGKHQQIKRSGDTFISPLTMTTSKFILNSIPTAKVDKLHVGSALVYVYDTDGKEHVALKITKTIKTLWKKLDDERNGK